MSVQPEQMPIASRILMLALVAGLARAQTFEVASIKPSAADARGMNINLEDGGRFITQNVPLRFLIIFSYSVRDHQLTGGPEWMNSARWDISAKPEAPLTRTRADQEKVKAMVRDLLAERFGLVLHRETKELPIYALVVAKNGSKLTESAPEAKGPSLRGGRTQLSGTKVPVDLLAEHLSNSLGRTVVDETGLKGNYDFKLEYLPEPGGMFGKMQGAEDRSQTAPLDSDLPSVFTALQEQLGLKLESKKGPVEILVIDKAEKATEN
jgi:uncharacterized protein (TIGR03435 family)